MYIAVSLIIEMINLKRRSIMSSFIPKPYPKEAVTVRVESEYLQQIDHIIALDGRFSRSSLINQCVKFALNNIDMKDLEVEEPIEASEFTDEESPV